MENTRLDEYRGKKVDDAEEARLVGCAAFQAGLVGEKEEVILGVSLLGKGWAQPLGNPNRLIEFLRSESSLFSFYPLPLSMRLEAPHLFFPRFSLPSHRSPLSSDLSHVPLRDQFVNRICELVVSHPPSFHRGSCTRRAEDGGGGGGRLASIFPRFVRRRASWKEAGLCLFSPWFVRVWWGGMCETLWRIFTHIFVPLSRNNQGTYCLFNSNRIFKIFLEDEKIPLSFSRNALQEERKFCENL